MHSLTLKSLSFSYDHSDKKIIHSLDISFPRGWTSIIGPNGCGKSTLLKILAGKLKATSGTFSDKLSSYYCEQETLSEPESFTEFKNAHDYEARRLKTSLGLNELFERPWLEMSCGEQKRFQLACALWEKPELLLVDEPSNHLDEKNRNYIVQALKDFKGIGVLVSHDRDLLESLSQQCLFFKESQFFVVSGSFSEATKQWEAKLSSWEDEKEVYRKKIHRLEKETHRLEKIQASSKNKVSKRKLSKHDKDAKAKINLAKLTGKDASLGQKKVNLQNRMQNLNQKVDGIPVFNNYSDDIAFDILPSHKKVILFQEDQTLHLPNGMSLNLPELSITSGDKIGIVGANGLGKSSFLNYLVNSRSFKTQNYFYLKQELSNQEKNEIAKSFTALDKESYTRCLHIISRLGSDAKQIFKSESWSAGEARKLTLALAIVKKVEFLILDEPTNHLDIFSIRSIEKALAESSLSLLIVSHDKIFLEPVCTKIWKIEKQGSNFSLNIIQR